MTAMAGGFIRPLSELSSPEHTSPDTSESVAESPPLTSKQEHRLIEWLDDRFLDINRGYNKRFLPGAKLPTLSSYLTALHPLLSVILLIPPVKPSSTLRVSYLLRLTGDFLSVIPNYPLIPLKRMEDDDDEAPIVSDHTPNPEANEFTADAVVAQLLDWITDLDQGWLAVFSSQQWDPTRRSGVQVKFESNSVPDPVSQTDRARLRSMLVLGKESLDDWLGESGGFDVDIREGFSELFWRTLQFLESEEDGFDQNEYDLDLDEEEEMGSLDSDADEVMASNMTGLAM